jgi:hypothetical protein
VSQKSPPAARFSAPEALGGGRGDNTGHAGSLPCRKIMCGLMPVQEGYIVLVNQS